MANVEGQRVPAWVATTSGGGAGWAIQGRPPCHDKPADHTRTWWRLHRPLFRQGHLPGQTGGNHLRPAARYRDGWQLRRLQPVGQAAQAIGGFGGLFGRGAGDRRWRCLRTLAAGGFGDVWQGGCRDGSGSGGGAADVSGDGGRGSRGLAGGSAAHADRHSALHARPGCRERATGGTHRTAKAGAADSTARRHGGTKARRHGGSEPGLAVDSTARGHRTARNIPRRPIPRSIPDRLPHRCRRLASHSRQRAGAGGSRYRARRRLA